MIVIKDLKNFSSPGTAVTVGKFDGVHIGHQKLLEALLKEKGSLESCVFTFDILKDNNILDSENRILSEEEKEKKFEDLGIEKLILFPFDSKTASISPENFVKDILVKGLNCKLLVVGDDFRFGKNREGDINLLKKLSKDLDFRLTVIKREEFEGSPVSSSRIREELKNNNYKKAEAMLGK
ncbi:MAG: hypothetical protein IJS80_06335 [Lachnospiraceae bacterium]|nr:hypothetical protein [Lachnospiraceae bacterium]